MNGQHTEIDTSVTELTTSSVANLFETIIRKADEILANAPRLVNSEGIRSLMIVRLIF